MQTWLHKDCDRANFSNVYFLDFIFNIKMCSSTNFFFNQKLLNKDALASMEYVDNEVIL